jgi:RND family efflux transporter MFP subunit
MKRVAPLPIALVVLAAGCSSPAREQSSEPLPVEVVRVAGAAATDSDRFPITVRRDREAVLSFRVPGILAAVPVRIGERLPAGALVASLDATPYRAAVTRAEMELARLTRADRRNAGLVEAGAVAAADREDTGSARTAAAAALESARFDAASARLTMPFAGVVLARSAERGETVGAGQAVARVADLSSALLARAAVPAPVAARLRPGMAARVRLDGLGAELAARVQRVGAASDARTATVEIDLALPAATPAAIGAIGSVAFDLPAAGAGEQRIPAEALLTGRDGWGEVFVYDPARQVARRTRLRVAGFDGEALRVSGLPAGAQVITAGAGFVADGQKVKVSAR